MGLNFEVLRRRELEFYKAKQKSYFVTECNVRGISASTAAEAAVAP